MFSWQCRIWVLVILPTAGMVPAMYYIVVIVVACRRLVAAVVVVVAVL